MIRNMLPSPVKRPKTYTRDRRVLSLLEIAVLRRVAKKERMVDISHALNIASSYPRTIRRQLREVFEVDTDEELLQHPDIIRQIREED